MKKTAKKMLSLLIMVLILLPSLAWAKPGDDQLITCDEHDYECLDNTVGPSFTHCSGFIQNMRSASAPWLEYNSGLFNVTLRIDANGTAVLKSLYPNLTKLIEKRLASKYGIIFPLRNKPNQAVRIGIGLIFDLLDVSLHLVELYDEHDNSALINAMITDLESHGFSHEAAVTEANQQFLGLIQPMSLLVTSSLEPSGAVAGIANLLRDIEILSFGKYYELWVQYRRAEVRERLQEQAAARRGPPTGRSYAEWAARREGSMGRDGGSVGGGGSFSGDCVYWEYHPGSSSYDPVAHLIIINQPYWTCERFR